MKVNAKELLSHLEKARVNGLVNEIVINDKGGFAVTDFGKNIVAFSDSLSSGYNLGVLGLFDLRLFLDYIKYSLSVSDDPEIIDITLDKAKVVFDSGKDKLKFLLSDPTVVSSTIENSTDVIANINANEDCVVVKLDKKIIDRLLKALQVVGCSIVTLTCSKGEVSLLAGLEIENSYSIVIGKAAKGTKDVSVTFFSNMFANILATLDFSSDVTMKIDNAFPVIFTFGKYILCLSPRGSV